MRSLFTSNLLVRADDKARYGVRVSSNGNEYAFVSAVEHIPVAIPAPAQRDNRDVQLTTSLTAMAFLDELAATSPDAHDGERGQRRRFFFAAALSPTEQMPRDSVAHAWKVWAEVQGLDNAPYVEWTHGKELGRRGEHYHRVYARMRATGDGRIINLTDDWPKNELSTAIIAADLGQPHLPGRHAKWVYAKLREVRPHAAPAFLDAVHAAVVQADKQRAAAGLPALPALGKEASLAAFRQRGLIGRLRGEPRRQGRAGQPIGAQKTPAVQVPQVPKPSTQPPLVRPATLPPNVTTVPPRQQPAAALPALITRPVATPRQGPAPAPAPAPTPTPTPTPAPVRAAVAASAPTAPPPALSQPGRHPVPTAALPQPVPNPARVAQPAGRPPGRPPEPAMIVGPRRESPGPSPDEVCFVRRHHDDRRSLRALEMLANPTAQHPTAQARAPLYRDLLQKLYPQRAIGAGQGQPDQVARSPPARAVTVHSRDSGR